MKAVRLKPNFNVAALQRDLSRLSTFFKSYQQEGNPINIGPVYVCPLYSPGGELAYLEPTATDKPFKATPALQQAPYFSSVLSSIPGPLYSVRLIQIPQLSGLKYHQDNFRNLQHGIVRLHVPVVSNTKAKMIMLDSIQCWSEGSCWYGDFSLPHRVINFGESQRTHLVMDVGVTPELLELFPKPKLLPQPRLDMCVNNASFQQDMTFSKYFMMPEGFLPQREVSGLACLYSIEDKIFLKVGGYQYPMAPIAGDQLVIETAGSGRVIKIREDGIELTILGAVRPYRADIELVYDVSMKVAL